MRGVCTITVPHCQVGGVTTGIDDVTTGTGIGDGV